MSRRLLERTPELFLNGARDGAGVQKIVAFPAETSAAPTELIRHSSHAPIVEYLHNLRDEHLTSIGLYLLNNVHVVDGVNHLIDGQVLAPADLIPDYWRTRLLDGSTGKDLDPQDGPVRIIDEPVVSVASLGYLGYGHWWLDMLPRLWLFRHVFGSMQARYKILLPEFTPAFALDMLRAYGFGDESWLWFRPDQPILLRNAILPSFLHNSYTFHSCFRLFAADAKARMAAPSSAILATRLYVSRRRYLALSAGEPRTLENEPDVVKLAADAGFQVIYPEEFSVGEKIDIFSRAEVIMGEFGSGLHHSMFSPPGAVTIAIGTINNVQSTIDTLFDHRNMYIVPQEETVDGRRVMTAPLDQVSEALERVAQRS